MIASLQIFTALSSVALAAVSMHLIDSSIAKGFSSALPYVFLFAALLLGQLGVDAWLAVRIAKTKEMLTHRLQQRFLEQLYRSEWNNITRYPSGDIQTRLTSDAAAVAEGWTTTIPTIIALVVQFFAAFFTLWHYDPTLAAAAFLLGPVTVAISWLIGRKLKRMQHHIQAAEGRYRSYLVESIRNILVVKSFEQEQSSMSHVRDLQQNKLYWIMKRSMFTAMTNMVIGLGYRLGFFLSFGFGAFKLSSGTTTFGTFAAFLQLVGQIQGPLEGLSRSFPVIIATLASAERLMEFEQLDKEAAKGLNRLTANPMTLHVENISFAYEAERPILREVSLTVNLGQVVAIVGTSGEGKTTLLRMLLALIQPSEGRIYLKGQRELAVSSDTRSFFSYVPQGNTLFSGTIADNIRIGKPDADDAEVIAASTCACAWDFISTLPHGLNTVIGENGIGLSEGQAQRIAIARAIIRQSPILLLDEATSALDLDTEREVLERLRHLTPLRTCIAITHRLSVTEICDHVYRIRGGRLVELGKEELISVS